jgi:hypothetical protein
MADYKGPPPIFTFKSKHVVEIDAVKWWSLDSLKYNTSPYITQVVIPILQQYAKYKKSL